MPQIRHEYWRIPTTYILVILETDTLKAERYE